MSYTDWLGQTIEVGSPVLYAVSNSHYAQQVWGEVMAIIPVEPETRNGEDYWPYDRKFKLKVQPHYQSDPRGDSRRNIEFKLIYDTPDGKWVEGASYTCEYERIIPKPVFLQNVEKVTVFELPPGVRESMDCMIDEQVEESKRRLAERETQ